MDLTIKELYTLMSCISNEKRRTLNEEKYTKLEVLRIKLYNKSKILKSLA